MATESRELRGRQICEKGTEIERLYEGGYRVASQSGQGYYSVLYSPSGDWWCPCPDHRHRTVKCKHIWAVEFSANLRKAVQKARTESVKFAGLPFRGLTSG